MAGKRPNKAAHGKGDKQQAAYFLSLSLENVRCFGPKQTLDLSDGKGGPAQWTILLGENGAGKTTVLQALAAFTPLTKPELTEHLSRPVPQGLFWDMSWHGAGFLRAGCTAETRFEVVISELATLHETTDQSHHFRPHLTINPGGHAKTLSPGDPPTPAWPVCYGYGAGRRLGATSMTRPEADIPIASLFSEDVPLRNGEEWLLLLDYSASKSSNGQQQRLKQVKQLLMAILPDVEGIRFNPSAGVFPKPCVEFQTPYGWVPLRSLGYGYQALIAWMVDFASRMVERYPDSADPLAEPAVVLVDEIDLHLHPQWQRKLIGHLTEHFPNTQFIVTAHSPLVVQAAKGANIALLRREGDHVVIDNDLKAIRGWRIDQIYTSDLFGLESARPPELDRPLKRRVEILSKSKLTAADRRELKALEKQIGDLPVGETAEQIRDLAFIRETLDELKQARAAGS